MTHTHTHHPHRKTNGFLLTPVVVVAVPPLARRVVSDLWLGICCCKDFYHQGHRRERKKDASTKHVAVWIIVTLHNMRGLIHTISPRTLEKTKIGNHHRINMSALEECVSDEVWKLTVIFQNMVSPLSPCVCVCLTTEAVTLPLRKTQSTRKT